MDIFCTSDKSKASLCVSASIFGGGTCIEMFRRKSKAADFRISFPATPVWQHLSLNRLTSIIVISM